MTIRPATEADIPRMIEVYRRAFLSGFAFTAPFPIIQQWIRRNPESVRYPAHWAEMFVHEQDGSISGLLQPTDDEINGLWIHPYHQGRGIGTRLLEFGESLVRQRGHARSWLTCSGFNPRALGFYRTRGYRVCKSSLEMHECGVQEEVFEMERWLDESSS